MHTVTIWSDLACPWAGLAVHRLWAARDRLGLVDDIAFDHRVFALEVVNAQPTPKPALDAEIPAIGALEPQMRWQAWSARESTYAVSTLLPMEAVQAAKEQSLAASALLDRALRTAFYADSRCISMRHVVLDVATECGTVDVPALTKALDRGSARAAVLDQHREAVDGPVEGSPHIFVADGTGWHNPGIESHWEGEKPDRRLVIDRDESSVYDEILRAAAR